MRDEALKAPSNSHTCSPHFIERYLEVGKNTTMVTLCGKKIDIKVYYLISHLYKHISTSLSEHFRKVFAIVCVDYWLTFPRRSVVVYYRPRHFVGLEDFLKA